MKQHKKLQENYYATFVLCNVDFVRKNFVDYEICFIHLSQKIQHLDYSEQSNNFLELG